MAAVAGSDPHSRAFPFSSPATIGVARFRFCYLKRACAHMTIKPTSTAETKHTATYAVTSRKCCQLLCVDVLGWSATFNAGPTAKRYKTNTNNSAAENAAGKPNDLNKDNIAGSPVTGEPCDTEIFKPSRHVTSAPVRKNQRSNKYSNFYDQARGLLVGWIYVKTVPG